MLPGNTAIDKKKFVRSPLDLFLVPHNFNYLTDKTSLFECVVYQGLSKQASCPGHPWGQGGVSGKVSCTYSPSFLRGTGSFNKFLCVVMTGFVIASAIVVVFRKLLALSTMSCWGRLAPTPSTWLRTGSQRRLSHLTPRGTTSWASSLTWAQTGTGWSWA